jgi:hypothetical protein
MQNNHEDVNVTKNIKMEFQQTQSYSLMNSLCDSFFTINKICSQKVILSRFMHQFM